MLDVRNAAPRDLQRFGDLRFGEVKAIDGARRASPARAHPPALEPCRWMRVTRRRRSPAGTRPPGLRPGRGRLRLSLSRSCVGKSRPARARPGRRLRARARPAWSGYSASFGAEPSGWLLAWRPAAARRAAARTARSIPATRAVAARGAVRPAGGGGGKVTGWLRRPARAFPPVPGRTSRAGRWKRAQPAGDNLTTPLERSERSPAASSRLSTRVHVRAGRPVASRSLRGDSDPARAPRALKTRKSPSPIRRMSLGHPPQCGRFSG